MEISIIIPVYNVKNYIIDCLESIYKIKDYSKLEVIIIDDCSPDNSIVLIKEFIRKNKADNIKIFHHEKNKGLGAARNTGIEKATKPYIWFIDSDDAINPEEFNKSIQELPLNFDVLLMGVIECDSNLIPKKNYLKYNNNSIENFSEKYKNKEVKQLDVVAWNKIINRDLFLLNPDLRFTEGVLNEDEIFSLILCEKSNSILFKESLVYLYRIRENSITTSTIKDNFFESWIVNFKEGFNFFKDYDVELWQDWFLEKIQVFNRKYDFSKDQLIKFKKILTPYYTMFPPKVWNNNWRHRENYAFFEDWFDIYKSKTSGKPLVSVVIPTYKRPKNLILAIQSVLDQSYQNIEIIVVNDTGNNPKYKNEYDANLKPFLNKISYIELPVNKGGGAARNIGMNKCNGDYICFLDDDDSYKVDRIKNAIQHVLEYASNEIWGVYCGYENNDSNHVNTSFYSGNLSYDILHLNYSEFSLNTDTVLIKRDFLEKYNIKFNPQLKRHQDLDLFLKLFNYGLVIGYDSVDVSIRPEKTEIGNWLNNEIMHDTKRYFLNQHKKTIISYPSNIQKEIYNIQWKNVMHYYLGSEKIQKFKNHIINTSFNKVDYHEYHFLLNLILETVNQNEQTNQKQKITLETNDQHKLKLEKKILNEKIEDLLNQKDWYENTYEKMPLWWKKLGALIRKIRK